MDACWIEVITPRAGPVSRRLSPSVACAGWGGREVRGVLRFLGERRKGGKGESQLPEAGRCMDKNPVTRGREAVREVIARGGLERCAVKGHHAGWIVSIDHKA